MRARRADAVTDKTPLGKEEMPAYWRLMAWEEHQSLAALRERAAKNVTFRELWQQPDRWRGKLVELTLHLGRTKEVDELADNELGMKSVHEVWGWNSESQPYWFWLVCPDLPPGMPEGTIQEEATFVGYFLKLLPYEDHQGKTLTTPLLVGRLVWHPMPASPATPRDEWTWVAYPAGAIVAVMLLSRAWTSLGFGRRKAARHDALEPRVDEHAVESWLESAGEDHAESSNGESASGLDYRTSAGPPGDDE